MAQLDALYSIAKLMRESKNEGYPLCFVEFLPDELDHAQVVINQGYLPVGRNTVSNDVHLGGDQPNKAIIAGPNGAGKSIYLKMIGCNELLAHALGIAIAESMQTSWFDAIRTCINVGESVKDANSKFQAEKKRMDRIIAEYEYYTSLQPSYRALLLADEPLSGTTEAIAARKINYNYIQPTQHSKHFSMFMATHNKELPKLTDEAGYANYQVSFQLTPAGLPEPTFKVTPGKPEWWFSDTEEDKRRQDLFVDYTTTLKNLEGYTRELAQVKQTRDFYRNRLEEYDRGSQTWIEMNQRAATNQDIEELNEGRVDRLKSYQIAQAELERIMKLIAQERRKINEWKS